MSRRTARERTVQPLMCRVGADCERRPRLLIVLGPASAIADCCGARGPPAAFEIGIDVEGSGDVAADSDGPVEAEKSRGPDDDDDGS